MSSRIGPAVIAPTLAAPAAWLIGAPAWFRLGLLVVSALLGAGHVVVTQVIRLRASACIRDSCDSRDAVRVLEIEDLPAPPRALRRRKVASPIRSASPAVLREKAVVDGDRR